MSVGPETTSLEGRVAIVTGGAQGIGQGAALALARFGADVAICDRNVDGMNETAAQIESTGRRVVTGELDVRDGPAVQEWVTRVGAELGRLDVLVNNAGGGFWAAFLDTNEKGQRALVDENFTSVTNFVRAGLPVMADGGSIINITSIEAHRAAPGFGIYAAMKAAVENLTKTLALELATRGIRVNAVAPDSIPTPGDEENANAVSSDREAYGRKIPLGWGEIDDCAGPIVFLACDLSRFVTGTVLHVDGGSHAASGWARRDDGTYEP
jgi:3-oxoacyl-[acyl-carrier protein] reductase